MKKVYASVGFLLMLCSLWAYSTYAQGSWEGRQLEMMCEKIQAYEEACGSASPSECKSNNQEAIDHFFNLCFFSHTSNSLACLKRINWLYSDMFTHHHIEPCKTSLHYAPEE